MHIDASNSWWFWIYRYSCVAPGNPTRYGFDVEGKWLGIKKTLWHQKLVATRQDFGKWQTLQVWMGGPKAATTKFQTKLCVVNIIFFSCNEVFEFCIKTLPILALYHVPLWSIETGPDGLALERKRPGKSMFPKPHWSGWEAQKPLQQNFRDKHRKDLQPEQS